jgi:hypothetical protein
MSYTVSTGNDLAKRVRQLCIEETPITTEIAVELLESYEQDWTEDRGGYPPDIGTVPGYVCVAEADENSEPSLTIYRASELRRATRKALRWTAPTRHEESPYRRDPALAHVRGRGPKGGRPDQQPHQ